MARYYASQFADSILASDKEDSEDIVYYDYANFTYDPVNKVFTIAMVDSTLVPEDEDDPFADLLDSTDYWATIRVSLTGGEAIFDDNYTEKYTAQLPDLSQSVFIWNNTNLDISFTLSCDDQEFSTRSLGKDEFAYYSCTSSEYVYIKVYTMVNGEQTGMVHYKLLKGNGYKVQWDKDGQKFEVYTDNRIWKTSAIRLNSVKRHSIRQ